MKLGVDSAHPIVEHHRRSARRTTLRGAVERLETLPHLLIPGDADERLRVVGERVVVAISVTDSTSLRLASVIPGGPTSRPVSARGPQGGRTYEAMRSADTLDFDFDLVAVAGASVLQASVRGRCRRLAHDCGVARVTPDGTYDDPVRR